MLLVLALMGVLTAVASELVSRVTTPLLPAVLRDMVTGTFTWFVLLYTFVCEAYTLGRFYVRNSRTLGWFVR